MYHHPPAALTLRGPLSTRKDGLNIQPVRSISRVYSIHTLGRKRTGPKPLRAKKEVFVEENADDAAWLADFEEILGGTPDGENVQMTSGETIGNEKERVFLVSSSHDFFFFPISGALPHRYFFS